MDAATTRAVGLPGALLDVRREPEDARRGNADHMALRAPNPFADLPLWPEVDHALPTHFDAIPPRHVHIIPSLNLGGAERIVCDLARQWKRLDLPVDVLVMRDTVSGYDVSEYDADGSSVRFHRLGGLPWSERTETAAKIILSSGLPAYAHLTSQKELEDLWARGCRTAPVVHNVAMGWRDMPAPWNVPEVPFVVACGELVARELAETTLEKPVRVLRHVLPAIPAMIPERRRVVRAAFDATEGTIVIGMVGRIVHQKRYTRAVSVLADLVSRGIDARLVILGAANGEEGFSARAAMLEAANRLGVRNRLSAPGPVPDAKQIIGAFDVLLNTSVFEGVSIATMEGAAAGIPVVSADVGGQFEAVPAEDWLLPIDAPDSAYADAVIEAAARGLRPSETRTENWLAPVAAQTWAWMAAMGPGAVLPNQNRDRLLFVTANLDVGGAQRSLCNLAGELARQGRDVTIAVCGPVGVPGFMTEARAAGARFVSVDVPEQGLSRRVGRVLSLAHALAPAALCFWNMDTPAKIAIAKALADGPVRIADASPGPLLYAELDNTAALAKTLSSSPDEYVASLDLLVSKYTGGLPALGRKRAKAEAVIPNGVPMGNAGTVLPAGEGPMPPTGADPRLAVVCVGRLASDKHPEMLPAIARRLGELVPGATLTVVGGVHAGDTHTPAVASALSSAVGPAMPTNLHFVGPDHRTAGFLPRFAALVMVSRNQGCPNTSLEALAAGIPVIANDDGGTREQVIDGATGRLLSSEPWDTLAERIAEAVADVIREPGRATEMGRNGRALAAIRFSMEAMAHGWTNALLGTPAEMLGAKAIPLHTPHPPTAQTGSSPAPTRSQTAPDLCLA